VGFFQGSVAVVTGAGSGIGRALTQELATRGSAVALADVDEAGLMETAASLPRKTAVATTHVVDVADEAAVRAFAEDVAARHRRVNLLINNAGVALLGTFEEISLDDLRWLMGINFWGATCRAFSASWRPRDRAPTLRVNSRCADLPKLCGTNWRELPFRCLAYIRAAFVRRSLGKRDWEPIRHRKRKRTPLRGSIAWRRFLRKLPPFVFWTAWSAASHES
jgi:NAD(P)-dependent dehydrogenase (short-subunit alcohol dehydrogenase family)